MESLLTAVHVTDTASLGMLPFIVQRDSSASLVEWAGEYRDWIETAVTEYGAILFRGFDVRTPPQFAECAQALCRTLVDYMYQSTPRTPVAQRIYTATEYPPAMAIPQHNENAYQRAWPLKLIFGCLQAAAEGGATPLARSADVTRRIGRELVEEFRRRRVMYVRNYGDGVDVTWETTFQTSSPADVDAYCAAHAITCEWLPGERLRTTQVCHGVATHPVTGAALWFNQAHLFHPSSLGPERHEALLEVFGESGLPRTARFGDGGEIEAATLDHIRRAYEAEAQLFGWQNGDVLLVDNMLVSHGRQPFTGPRNVVVAMGDLHQPA
jgi:alpha-ketoglutarate-dependent taurine dioxygenase